MSDTNDRCAWLKNGNVACVRSSGQWCLSCQVFFGGASPTSIPLTKDTITDEQIRELREWLAAEADRAAEACVRVDAPKYLTICNRALHDPSWGYTPYKHERAAAERDRKDARAGCAEIINARRQS